MSEKVKLKGKWVTLPRGWRFMSDDWIARMVGMPLDELMKELQINEHEAALKELRK